MVEQREYRLNCPECHKSILIADLFPEGFVLNFFVDFKVTDGKFENKRCFPSITNQYKKFNKTKKADEPKFVRRESKEVF